jgi:hypothetical protein
VNDNVERTCKKDEYYVTVFFQHGPEEDSGQLPSDQETVSGLPE